jgi:hypothetical protein
MEDGTIKTYEYNGNVVGLLQWMSQKRPQDVDNLSPHNRDEIDDNCHQSVIVAPHEQDPLIHQREEILSPIDEQYLSPCIIPFAIMYLTLAFDPQYHDSLIQVKNGLVETTQPLSIADGELDPQFYSHDPQGISMFPSIDGHSYDLYIHQMMQHEYPQQQLEPEQSQYGTLEPNYDAISQNQSLHLANPMRQLLQPSPLFHPYRTRPSKGFGRLIFKVKPDTLGNYETWSPTERQNNRRVIAFSKHVMGDTIHVDCLPINSNDYKENMMTISCIRWVHNAPGEIQHKFAGQCIFTSVDIISLLERLVDHKFSVQEKNRIRRNLEGYKPETVRKEGTTGSFFNQVMSYVSPKTRNIEKDIKVFLWSDITKALRKIIQKYHVNGNGPPLGRPTNTPTQPPFSMTSQASSSNTLPLPPPLFSFPSQNSSVECLDSHFEDYSQQFSPLQTFTRQGQEFSYLSSSASEISPGSVSPVTPIVQIAILREAQRGLRYNSSDFGELRELEDDIPREFV